MRALSPTAVIPFLLFLFTTPLHAAPPALSGVVVTEEGTPLAGAEVVTVQVNDPRKSEVSARADAAERFRIQVEDCGQVVLKAGAGVELVQPGSLPEPGPFRATTGPDGRFTLSGVSPGVYALRVAHPEHPRFYHSGIDIPEGSPKVDLGGFALGKPLKVEGQVVDQEGRPVAGVRILQANNGSLETAAAPVTDPNGRFVLPEVVFASVRVEARKGKDYRQAQVAREGLYRLGGLGPGEWTLTAHARDGRSVPTRVLLKPSQEALLDLEISRDLALRGRVLEPDGVPAATAQVQVTRSGEIGGVTVWTDENGGFSVKVPSGSYSILVTHARSAPFRLEGFAVAEPLDDLEIRLRPGLTLTGRVLALPAGAQATLQARQEGILASTQAGPDGTYRFDNLGPGEWKLRVHVSGEGLYREKEESFAVSPDSAGRFDFYTLRITDRSTGHVLTREVSANQEIEISLEK